MDRPAREGSTSPTHLCSDETEVNTAFARQACRRAALNEEDVSKRHRCIKKLMKVKCMYTERLLLSPVRG